nr:MAG TPA: hypothetical protein [Caudoviricetes sp.]
MLRIHCSWFISPLCKCYLHVSRNGDLVKFQ